MLAASVRIEDFAWIDGKIRKGKTARGGILGGSVAHEAVTTLCTDQHEIARPRFRTPLGTVGDVDGPSEAKPRQQSRQPASIATRIERGRLTAGGTRASFDLKQGIAGTNDQADACRSHEDALPGLLAGYLGIERAPGRKPDLLDTMGRHRVSEHPELIGFNAPKGSCDPYREPAGAQLYQAGALNQRRIGIARIVAERIEPRADHGSNRRKAFIGKVAHTLPLFTRRHTDEGKACFDGGGRRGSGRD